MHDQRTLEGFFASAAEDSVNGTPPENLVRKKDPATSRAAAFSAKELRVKHSVAILHELWLEWGGLTSEEVARAAGLEHAQVWRRMSELSRAGRIVVTGEKRKNRSGRMAQVWRLK